MAKTYSEKLKDPRWQKMRLRVMERDKFTCRDCCSTDETLHVHHAFYEKGADPWEYEDRYLVTLCERCHEKAEETRLVVLKAMASPYVSRNIVLFVQALQSGGVSIEFLSWALGDIARMISHRNQILEDPSVASESVDEIRDAVGEATSSLHRFLFCIEEQTRKERDPFPESNESSNPSPSIEG